MVKGWGRTCICAGQKNFLIFVKLEYELTVYISGLYIALAYVGTVKVALVMVHLNKD